MCNHDDGCLSERQLILHVQEFLQHKSPHEHPAAHLSAAWRRFYRDYSPQVRRVASRYLADANDQDDCFQQVWLALLVLLPRLNFDPVRGTFRGWLSTVTRRLTQQFVRQRDRQQAHITVQIPEWEQTVTIRVSGPLEKLQARERIGLVHQVLQQLQDRLSLPTYRVFYLRSMEGQSFDEIAKRLNLTSQQVRFRHQRAKQKAAQLMTLAGRSACE